MATKKTKRVGLPSSGRSRRPRGQPVGSDGKQEPSTPNGLCWKPHLDMYRRLRALKFADQQQYAAAAELLWNELRELPFEIVGNHTIIVPAEATPCFKGLQFEETEVLSPGDLSAEELADLRREQRPY